MGHSDTNKRTFCVFFYITEQEEMHAQKECKCEIRKSTKNTKIRKEMGLIIDE